jgi:hypothetical protein
VNLSNFFFEKIPIEIKFPAMPAPIIEINAVLFKLIFDFLEILTCFAFQLF